MPDPRDPSTPLKNPVPISPGIAADHASAFPLIPCDQADKNCLFDRVQEVEELLRPIYGDIPAMKAGDEVLRTGLRLLRSERAQQMLPHERAALCWRVGVLTARRAIALERRIVSLETFLPPSQELPMEDDDFFSCFRKALDQLTEPQRMVVDLLLDGLSFRKAAAHLGIGLGAVRSRIASSRKMLRKTLPYSIIHEFFRGTI